MPSSARAPTCPVPIALVGHDTLVPAVLLGLLVAASVALFARSLAATAVATMRAKRDCARRAVGYVLRDTCATTS